MHIDHLNKVYFIGIGGIGMSAIARYFNKIGITVTGYDRVETVLTRQMSREGMHIHYVPDVKCLTDDTDLAVYTPAIPDDHPELVCCREKGIPLMKRAELLGIISKSRTTVAVAGTHGKTTTASMIAHLLCHAGRDCMAFVGGIAVNYNSNFISHGEFRGKEAVLVVEADEYDQSFLTLSPDVAVITSMDADHLDIYADRSRMEDAYRQFASQVRLAGLIVKKGLCISTASETYAFQDTADHVGEDAEILDNRYRFTYRGPAATIREMIVGIPGKYNLENATAACAVAFKLGLSAEDISNAMAKFKGVKRRFEYVIRSEEFVFVDDYAHHPVEIASCIATLRELYPEKEITGVFQPHLFTRTRDFAKDFGKALSDLDRLILLPVYPAREEPIEGVDSALIYDFCTLSDKMICEKEELPEKLTSDKPQILVTMGAGDIDALVEPIKKLFSP